jgi:hypothetical protein
MSIIFSHNMLCRYVKVKNSENVKEDREPSIVVYGTDICDLSGLKRHI